MTGRVHSFQSLGALDGPGIRFVAFLQGCNLRCGCCHNPDTQCAAGGTEYTAEKIIEKAKRYKEYFGAEGGITLSGGEPLLQAEFAREVFMLAKNEGINTCLDTSGSILNDKVRELLCYTDTVLLDVKYTNEEDYLRYARGSLSETRKFLYCLFEMNVRTIVRQVIIPTLNDTAENIEALKNVTRGYTNVEKIELLPFRKVCEVKYEQMGTRFPFAHIPEPTAEKMAELEALLKKD
ncbi:MAG: pyruvate formate lyase-activating protein [Clostridia bacterium]|nr:pyruvate formate lyase-activating protein [Clostridia bacterium]